MPVDKLSLRLGNWVTLPLKDIENIITTIDSLGYERCGLTGNLVTNKYEDLEPVLITEELLLRIGFEKHSESEFWINYTNKDKFCISHYIGEDGLNGFKKGVWYVDNFVEISSLHWLHNYFYFTYGKELEILNL